jgi:hypothetical protein
MNVYKSHSLVLGLTGFSKANDENDKKFTDDEPKGFVYFNAAINGNITSALSYMAGFRNFANTQVFDPYWRSTKYLNIERMDRRIWIGLKYALKW